MATKGRQKDLDAYERAARHVDEAFSVLLDQDVPVVSPSATDLWIKVQAVALAGGEAGSSLYYVTRTLEELVKQGVVQAEPGPRDGRAPDRYTKVKGDADYISRFEVACEKLQALERLRQDTVAAFRGAEFVPGRLDVLTVPVAELAALLDGRRPA